MESTVTSIPGKIVEKIVDELLNATVRQFGYLYHYKNNFKALSTEQTKLAGRRNDLQAEIDAAKRNGKPIKDEVQSWIAQVDDITAAAKKILEDEVKANKRCFGGQCINPYSLSKLSKEAKEKTLAISKLIKEGNFGQGVSLPAPPPGIIYSSKPIFDAFESRKAIMKQIKTAMDDESFSVIGLCGIGGVGKTTLVEEIGKQAKEDKLYDAVVMAVASQNPSIVRIQEELAKMLGLSLPDNDDSARARSLWNRIKQEKRILVILDDLWKRLDLEKVGIPFGGDHTDCKILLTSRNQDVCHQMKAQKVFTIATLSNQESWMLFRKEAGQVVDNSDINPIAREVAAKCGGLPIAILTVGRALMNKTDKHVWTDAAHQLKKSTPTNILGMDKSVISSLELSYNFLENEDAKSLFLFCCLFPEDSYIWVEDLVRYGMGLRLFKDVDTIEKARDRAHAVVSSLASSFLLIADEDEYIGVRVKMHDVVRDVAIEIASKHNNSFKVKAGIGLREWPIRDTFEDFTRISLMSNDLHKVPDGLKCPNLQALLLQKNSPLLITDKFFEEMKDLKVLDLNFIKPFSLPSSLSFLVNLRTLRLDYCEVLGDLLVIGSLINLEILSLCRSNIEEIPKSFRQLSHLRLLDLEYCQRLSLIQEGVISCLDKLEELYISKVYETWDFESNAKVVELQVLSRLTRLSICFPKNSTLPNHMPFQNLKSFSILVGVSASLVRELWSEKSCFMRRMVLSYDMRVSPLFDWIKNLLEISELLHLQRFIGAEDVDGDLVNGGFTELKKLYLIDCDDVKYLVNTRTFRREPRQTFNNLEYLSMHRNPKFVEICHGQVLPAYSFGKLKSLNVSSCGSILNMVPANLLQRLQNLESCSVESCDSLVHVFYLQGIEIVNEETKFLSSLEDLNLSSLPEMTHIWKGGIRLISLRSLRTIFIRGCDKLVNVFTTSMAKSLVLLDRLTVESCSAMQEIVMDDDDEGASASTERIVFPRLETMVLFHLDSLTCFCSGRYPIEFPVLNVLGIVECPEMKTFGYGDVVTPKLNETVISSEYEDRMIWKGNLNDTIQHHFYQQEEEREDAGRLIEITSPDSES